jgi:hypothetical protein
MRKSFSYLLVAIAVFVVSCNKTEKKTNEDVLQSVPLEEVVDTVKVEVNDTIVVDSVQQTTTEVEKESKVEKSTCSQTLSKKSNCKKQNNKEVEDRGQVAIVDSIVIEEINIAGKIYNIAPNKDSLSWNDAVTYCDTLSLGGFDNWYLPDVSELSSIYKNKERLSNIKVEDYWSNKENCLSALVVYFGNGQSFYFDKLYRCNVRCIRKE